ncbi:MAG: glucose dehydrogenase [Bradyrhizobium sp.]|jgi:choline dehydrogenase-like flavoprotein|nr:glucose dehydrogenase [Bradyrhizobium sp.]
MANDDIDVVIVGSGFAGALIANELAKEGKKVVILEAGEGVPPNINDYMTRFYTSSAKVPESPYPPALFAENGQLSDPGKIPAGRPTVMTLGSDWIKPEKSYLVQNKQDKDRNNLTPFSSTYNRVAGGTSHWLGTSLRFLPSDFRMKTLYGASEKNFVDWPIGYDHLDKWYAKAEAELGVSANVEDQGYLGIKFPAAYQYPMPGIPETVTDRAVRVALKTLTPADTAFLKMAKPPTEIKVLATPAARNSQPYKNRRACAGNTNCIPICPIQAKYDPTITLNEALNHKHVTMMERTVAYNVVVDGDGRVSEIKYIRYSIDKNLNNLKKVEGSIKARIFVIAANAIETPRLLLMSKNDGRTPDGVANSSKKVGRYLMDHPYYVAWGQLPMTATPLWPYRGPLITSGIEDLRDGPFRSQRGAFRMDIGNEGWNFVIAGPAGGADPNMTTIDFVNGLNRSLPLPKRGGVGKFGPALTKALNDNITRQFRVGFLIEQTPDPNNRVTVSKTIEDGLGLPRPEVSYKLSAYDKRGIVAANQMKKLLFKKMGATDFTMVPPGDPTRFVEQVDGQPVDLNYTGAGHIMGTYRMGTDAKESVVNSYQCSHDHKNLYLVGSGTFPTGATANPTLTIAALSLRTADHIINEGLK